VFNGIETPQTPHTAYSSKGNENALEVSEKVLRKNEIFQLASKLLMLLAYSLTW